MNGLRQPIMPTVVAFDILYCLKNVMEQEVSIIANNLHLPLMFIIYNHTTPKMGNTTGVLQKSGIPLNLENLHLLVKAGLMS